MPSFSGFSLRRLRVFAWTLLVAGAAFGSSAVADDDGREEIPWAFAKVRRPDVPQIDRGKPARHPIDAFVAARLHKAGLQPTAQADRLVLLQRAFHDTLGLVPTPEEREAFLADVAPDAYERLVDRLLASPHFGERWAQHWLDVVRYSETEGFKVDRDRPDAWRYRDYVIRAFNDDLPYDRFVQQQLAGDELEPENPDAQIATGFLRLFPEETNGADYRQIRQDILDDVTDVVGSAFMGITLGCARCHDHKADPISQKDYYRFQAFLAPLLPRDDVSLLPRAAAAEHAKRRQAWEDATRSVRDRIDALVRPFEMQIAQEVTIALDPETQQALKTPKAERSALQRQLACFGGKQVENRIRKAYRRLPADQRKTYDELQKELAAFDRLKPAPAPTAMGVTDVGDDAPKVFRLAGGSLNRKREEAQPAFPEIFGDEKSDFGDPASHPKTTGRRSALARWLTRPDHPLASRVIANRIWQHYFGEGIVATPSDFGAMGARPTHPELLDWLASELVRSNWKLKSIHRLVLTSATYRQSSSLERNPTSAAALRIDPDNHLLWHARIRRMDGETLRDVALQVSGSLEGRMFGPSAMPALPKAVLDGRYSWSPDAKPEDRNRRSIYVYHRRNLILPFFQAFDAPNRNAPCAARQLTVTAPQSLTLLNGNFMTSQARRTAGKLLAQTRDPHHLAEAAYLCVLGRPATPQDLSAAERFLQAQSRTIAHGESPTAESLPEPLPAGLDAASAAAVVDLVHALMSSCEFLYVE